MSADPIRDLAQCEREIAAAAAYTGPDEIGAAMGWADSVIERELIWRDLRESAFSIHHGDALEVLRTLPDGSVHCCVTSPPYYGLRDYGTARWDGGDSNCDHRRESNSPDPKNPHCESANGHGPASQALSRTHCAKCGALRVDQQIGLEPTPAEYIARLVDVFAEVRRVLADDGTLWINIGDSYANDGKWGGSSGGKHVESLHGNSCIGRGKKHTGLKPKDLIGIPWMLAFALRADGWWLREDIIWRKRAPMPESVKDRCTRSHEYIFHFAKSAQYYHDHAAIAEPGIAMNGHDATGPGYSAPGQTPQTGTRKSDKQRGHSRRHVGFNDRWDAMEKAQQCGSMRNRRSVWDVGPSPVPEAHFATYPVEIPEICLLAGSPAGGVVLDPFAGAGTTGLACLKTGRRFVGIELNAQYIQIAHARAQKYYPLLIGGAA